MDTESLTFLVIEAVLSETGDFELLRGYEATEVPSSSSHLAGDDEVEVALLDEQNAGLYSDRVPVTFNDGCSVGSRRVATAVLFKAVPLYPDAARLVVRFRGAELFSSAIATDRPTMSNLEMSVDEDTARLTFSSNASEGELRVYAQTNDGRLLGTRTEVKEGHALVALGPLKGLGEVSLVIEATHDFRSARLVSEPIAVAEAAVQGAIMEPVDQSSWPYGKRGSLIASMFDENGRHLKWDENRFGWAINGEAYGADRQLEGWSPQEAGTYVIQLLKRDDNGQSEALSEVSVTVQPPTEDQLKFYQLLKDSQTDVAHDSGARPSATLQEVSSLFQMGSLKSSLPETR